MCSELQSSDVGPSQRFAWQALLHRFPRQVGNSIRAGESMEIAMENAFNKMFALLRGKIDGWIDRHIDSYMWSPGPLTLLSFSGCRQLNIVMPLWSQICQVKSHQRLIFGVQDTQHADNFATLSHDMNMSKPKIWVMCDTKLSIFEVIAKFFWPTNKCPHVVYLKKKSSKCVENRLPRVGSLPSDLPGRSQNAQKPSRTNKMFLACHQQI